MRSREGFMVFCFDGKGLVPHIAGGEETGPGQGLTRT